MATPRLTIFVSHPSPYMTDCEPHGDGLIAFSFLKELAKAGHTVHVATPLYKIAGTVPENLILHHLPMRATPSDDKQSLPFRVEYALRVRRLFSRLRQTVHFDVIHQMNPVVLGLSSLLHGQGVPMMMGPFWSPWPQPADRKPSLKARIRTRLRDLLLQAAVRQCDGVLAPNALTADLLRRAGKSPDRIFMLPIGIDTDAFYPDPARTPARPTILYLAGLWKRKGIYPLLSAFELLASRIPDAELHIAGSGEEKATVEAQIRSMRAGSRVRLLGPIQRSQVRETMQGCSIYCLPSFGEPFGMSALEAMACGKPLVVTNSGGLAELVPPQGGIQVRPGDSAKLADALQKILEHPELAAAMGAANRDFALQRHSWSVVSSVLANNYRTLQQRCKPDGIAAIDLTSTPETSQ